MTYKIKVRKNDIMDRILAIVIIYVALMQGWKNFLLFHTLITAGFVFATNLSRKEGMFFGDVNYLKFFLWEIAIFSDEFNKWMWK